MVSSVDYKLKWTKKSKISKRGGTLVNDATGDNNLPIYTVPVVYGINLSSDQHGDTGASADFGLPALTLSILTCRYPATSFLCPFIDHCLLLSSDIVLCVCHTAVYHVYPSIIHFSFLQSPDIFFSCSLLFALGLLEPARTRTRTRAETHSQTQSLPLSLLCNYTDTNSLPCTHSSSSVACNWRQFQPLSSSGPPVHVLS